MGDAKDIVGKTGWVTTPNDPKSLAKCLDSALKTPQHQLKNYGKIARQKIINEFHIKDVRKQFISLYNSILT